MNECICTTCKNLISVVDNSSLAKNGFVEEYECVYGFPSEVCSDCEADGCELTCSHYMSNLESENLIAVKCISCGKELKVTSNKEEDGDIYCVSCYLNS